MEEAALLMRLRAGEEGAYRDLLHRHGGRLLAVARRLMRDEEAARDCLQEALISAFRAIDRFEGRAALTTWLHRIVVNACLMKLRSRRGTLEDPVDPQLAVFDGDGLRDGPTQLAPFDADELIAQKQVREQVRKGIESLPDGHRIVLILRDIEGLGTAEVAKLLGMTPGAVKMRLHRARLALRDQLGSLVT